MSEQTEATEVDKARLAAAIAGINQAKLRYKLGEEVTDDNRQQIFDLAMAVLTHEDLFEPATVTAAHKAVKEVFGVVPGELVTLEIAVSAAPGDATAESDLAAAAARLAASPHVLAVEHTRVSPEGVTVNRL